MFGIDDLFISVVVAAVVDIVIEMAPKIIEAVCAAVKAFAESMGTGFGPQTNVEDLGDRAMQAAEAGVVPENFDSFEEYTEAIDDFELDPEKSEKYDPKDKQAAGISVMYNAGMDKLNVQESTRIDFFELMKNKPEYFTPERMVEISDAINKGQLTAESIVSYLNDTLKNAQEIANVRNALANIEMELNPEMTLEDAMRYVKSQKA